MHAIRIAAGAAAVVLSLSAPAHAERHGPRPWAGERWGERERDWPGPPWTRRGGGFAAGPPWQAPVWAPPPAIYYRAPPPPFAVPVYPAYRHGYGAPPPFAAPRFSFSFTLR